jgi:multicomponent K+:H+ antiporter subunit A
VVLRIAGGTDMSESHDGRHVWLIAAGLLIAGATGAASGWFGHPFLTSTFAHPEVPLLGDIPLASAALFDLGVFLCVVGATLLALLAPRQVARSTPDASAGAAR